MALIRWGNDLYDPWEDFEKLQNEINDLFNTNRTPESRGLYDRTISPPIDIVENPDDFTVYCDVPGMSIDDLDISITQDILTLKGEKKSDIDKEDEKVYRQETWSGKFQRTLSLPKSVDTNKVDATLKDGVLHIVLPKKEEQKPKQITVQTK